MTSPQDRNEQLKAIISRARIDSSYIYRADDLLDEKIRHLADHCDKVLDIGKSSRLRYAFFKSGQTVTLDINQYDDYPDVVDDICNIQKVSADSFDGIVCLAVLEHVYDPHAAINNLHAVLRSGGHLFLYVPFLYRYHAPSDL